MCFIQAEDGIRDAQESRGLGDVYKRQYQPCTDQEAWAPRRPHQRRVPWHNNKIRHRTGHSVSYTHLTLPTIYSV